jgi:hypothetical protein
VTDQSSEVALTGRLLQAVAGVDRGEIEGWLGDFFRTRRPRSVIRTLERSQDLMRDAGLGPKAISLKTLWALLEGASLEDERDDRMINMWSALLAKAAAGVVTIPGGYIEALRGLTSAEGQLLERLAVGRAVLPETAELRDLERRGLIEWDAVYDDEAWTLTSYGAHFLALCSEPVVRSDLA